MHLRATRPFVPMLAFAAFVLALQLFVVSTSRAGSAPVGPLPGGTVSTVKTQRGRLVAVALPRPKPSTGLVWRIARSVDGNIVRQLDETETASSVVLVFRVVGYGKTSVVFALTRGDASPKALSSHTTKIVSRTER